MSNLFSGKTSIRAVLLEGLHHGAGSSGNTARMRTQEIVRDGKLYKTPFLSANSFKHFIRSHGASYAINAMNLERNSLPKGVIDLLFSGGALTKSGSKTDLYASRKLDETFPLLAVCGYSAGNSMVESKISIRNFHLVCEENAWRLPQRFKSLQEAGVRASVFKGEEFGTRHDTHGKHAARNLMDIQPETIVESVQMIYDFQIIKPGATLFSSFTYRDLSEMETAALYSAFHHACEGQTDDGGLLINIAAKNSLGFGQTAMYMQNEMADAPCLVNRGRDLLDKYYDYLVSNKIEIVETLKAAV